MTDTQRHRSALIDDDAAALVATVLEEEAKRQERVRRCAAPKSCFPTTYFLVSVAMRCRCATSSQRGSHPTIAVLFGLGMADNLINNGAFQVLAPDIQDTFKLTDGEIGLIAALAGFTIFATALPLGSLGDRTRRTFVAGFCTILWGVFAAVTGMVHSVWQLVAVRVVTGMGQANEQPIQSSLLADAYPPEGRGRIFGIHRAATPMGLLLGPVIAGAIAAAAGGEEGWRWAFIVLAIPPLVLGVAALFLHEPKRGRHEQLAVLGEELSEVTAETPIALGAAFARLKKIKSFYYLMAALGAFGIAIFTVPVYLNLILEDELGLSAGERGVVGTITAIGALAGAVVGGRYSDMVFRRSPELTLRLVAIALASLGVGFGIQAYSPNVVFYCTVGIASQFYLWAGIVPASPMVAAIVPYRLRSTGFAMVGLYLSLVGGIGGALILGGLAESAGEQMAVAVVAPSASLLAAGLVLYGARFIRGDIARAVTDLLEERDEQPEVRAFQLGRREVTRPGARIGRHRRPDDRHRRHRAHEVPPRRPPRRVARWRRSHRAPQPAARARSRLRRATSVHPSTQS